MTRKLSFLIIPLALLIFVTTCNAQTVTILPTQTTTGSATESTTKLKQQLRLVQEQRTATRAGANEGLAAIQAKRDEFKANILKIKDQKKKALIERIDAKIAEVNTRITANFTRVLTVIQEKLSKIQSQDPKVLPDIATVQTAIDLAKIAVDKQAANIYTITIGTDLTLKANAGTIVSQFRQDIVAVHELVIDAKQAYQKLNTDKSTIKREATSSAEL
jgi:hypothetical protein